MKFEDTFRLTEIILRRSSKEQYLQDVTPILRDNISWRESQSCLEVTQHAVAFDYLCTHHLEDNLSEDLILKVHEILCGGLFREDGEPVFAGKYRTQAITVGRTGQECLEPSKIKAYMTKMITLFNGFAQELQTNRSTSSWDPIALATWLKYILVSIHPFNDGNGRTSRLFLNWALLKFGIHLPTTLQMGFSRKAKRNYFRILRDSPPLPHVKENLSCCKPVLLNRFVLESVHSAYASLFEQLRFIDRRYTLSWPSDCPQFGPAIWKGPNSTINFENRCSDLKGYISKLNELKNKDVSCLLRIKKIKDQIILHLAMYCRHNEVPTAYSQASSTLQEIINAPDLEQSYVNAASTSLKETEIKCLGASKSYNATRESKTDGCRPLEALKSMCHAYNFLCVTNLKRCLSSDLIKDVYKILSPVPPNIEREMVHIGPHQFPPASCVDKALEDLAASFNQKLKDSEADILFTAAHLMYELLALHPFPDGNGRVSRLFYNWAILSHGIDFPVSFWFEKDVRKGKTTLNQATLHARLHGGHPGVLATRGLVGLLNSYELILSQANNKQ